MTQEQAPPPKLSLWIAALSTLIAGGFHLYLTLHYYQLKVGGLEGESVCNINQMFNCDVVSLSIYAQIFNVPMALLGLLTALITISLIVMYQWNLTLDKKTTGKVISFLSLTTLLASVVMGLISMTQLKSYCLFCIITYILSLISFIGIYKGLNGLNFFNGQDVKNILTQTRWPLVVLLLIPAGGFLGNQMMRKHYRLDEIQEFVTEVLNIWQAAPQNTFTESGLVYHKSTSAPSMTIVEFADFKCGHCQKVAPVFSAFKKKHPDVKFIFKSFPLDGSCNDSILDRNGNLFKGDGTRCLLAQLTHCASKQNKGWEFHDWIFKDAKDLYSKTEIKKQAQIMADEHNIDGSQLISCLDSDESLEVIKGQVNEGVEAKVKGTPSVYINGRKIGGTHNPVVLESIYRSLKSK